MTLPEHVRRNRAEWTRWAPEYAEWAPRAWAREEFTWGVWGVSERELGVFPASVEGLDVLELIWADPYRWVPEAARLLRPGGLLVFLVNGTLSVLYAQDEEVPPGPELRRPYFGMHRFEWTEDDSVEFHLGYGDWIRLLAGCGCEVLDLLELQASAEGEPHGYPTLPERWWARRWRSEEIWKARKLASP